MAEMAPLASAPSRPSRKRISRALGIFGVLIAFVAIIAVSAPWVFSTKALRDEIVAQIRQMTGLVAISQGKAVFVVLPQPHINIEDIGFTDPSGALAIDARVLKGYFRVAPLFLGRLEIAWASLVQPKMVIDLDGRPLPADSAIGRAAYAKSDSAQAFSADEATLGAVSLINGSARLKSKLATSDILIDAINVTLDWRKLGAAASVTGQARFRGETANIAARIARPSDLLRGGQSAISLQIASPALTLSTEGALASAPRPQYTGHIVASAPSVRKLVESSGYFVRLPGPFDDFALTCDASIGASNAALSALRLRLDGNDFEGALAIQAGDKRPLASGTLATNLLSLRPFLSTFPAMVGRDGQWSRDPFDLSVLGLVDLDLRVSAARVILPRFAIEDAAFSVMNKDSRLDFNLAQAKAYRGSVKGRASFASADESGLVLRASSALSGIDIAAAAPGGIGGSKFAGAMTSSGNIESSGASMSDLMRNLDGQAQFTLAHGEVGGIDLEQALRRIDKRPLALAADIRHGGTTFESASFGLKIANGLADIEAGALQSPSVTLRFDGIADLAERGLNLHAVAAPSASGENQGRETPTFRFDVIGPWDDLAFLPDVGSLIRHSGAAAPLLSRQPDADKPSARGAGGEN
jgi:AsmA protein